MNSERLLAEVRRQLVSFAEPEHREGAFRFFQEQVELYGVRSPDVKKVTSFAYREWKQWKAAERNAFCESLWANGSLEEGSVAISLYRKVAKSCGRCEFKLFERWIDRHVRNWAHCDGVSSWLVAASIGNVPELIGELPRWTRSRNRWKRRTAAVSLLQEAKRGRHTVEIFEIADLLIEDDDDMVQKGTGWLLKETYPKRPSAVVRYLEPRKQRPVRLLLRYAAEKMTPADKARILN